MTAADFAVWLRGFLAACGNAPLSAAQLEMVRAELAKVVAVAPPVFVPTIPLAPLALWQPPTGPQVWYGAPDPRTAVPMLESGTIGFNLDTRAGS